MSLSHTWHKRRFGNIEKNCGGFLRVHRFDGMKVKSNKFNLFLDLTISNVVDISICLDIHEKAAISLK